MRDAAPAAVVCRTPRSVAACEPCVRRSLREETGQSRPSHRVPPQVFAMVSVCDFSYRFGPAAPPRGHASSSAVFLWRIAGSRSSLISRHNTVVTSRVQTRRNMMKSRSHSRQRIHARPSPTRCSNGVQNTERMDARDRFAGAGRLEIPHRRSGGPAAPRARNVAKRATLDGPEKTVLTRDGASSRGRR